MPIIGPSFHATTSIVLSMCAFCVARSAAADDTSRLEASDPNRELVAIVVVAGSDKTLSDNLTEVAISTLAGTREWDFVGLRELRRALARLEQVQQGGLAACLERSTCRREIVRVSGAGRALLGNVQARPDGYSINLFFSGSADADLERTLERRTPPGVKSVISGLQGAVRDLVLSTDAGANAAPLEAPAPSGPQPATEASALAATTTSAPSVTTASEPSLAKASSSTAPSKKPTPAPWLMPIGQRHNPRQGRTSPARYVTYGAALTSVLCLSGAAVTGSIAAGTPTGSTRADVEADLHRREGYHKATLGLVVSAAVFATVSLVSLTFR